MAHPAPARASRQATEHTRRVQAPSVWQGPRRPYGETNSARSVLFCSAQSSFLIVRVLVARGERRDESLVLPSDGKRWRRAGPSTAFQSTSPVLERPPPMAP